MMASAAATSVSLWAGSGPANQFELVEWKLVDMLCELEMRKAHNDPHL
jgi:hypothetical protein